MATRKTTKGEEDRAEYLAQLGRRVDQAAKARGVATNELDRASEQTQGQTSRLVNGKRVRGINPHTIKLYARALRVSLAWLAWGDGEMGDDPQLEQQLRKSLERDNIDRAVDYHGGIFSPEAVKRTRAAAGDVAARSPREWAEELFAAEEQLHAERKALKGKLA